MRNVLDKIVETITSKFFIQIFFPKKPAVNKIMWKIIVELDRPQMTIYEGVLISP